ncbi:helix-turn-helix domain-containing protein [Flagellimonas sp. 2504JD1-5]
MEHFSEITFDLWSALLIFGLLQGIFFCVALMVGFSGRKSKYFLVSLVMVISLNLLNYLIINTNLYTTLPHLAHISLPLLFLIGPLFLYYIKSSLTDQLKLSATDLLHSIPFLVAVVFMLPFFGLAGETKIEFLQAQTRPGGQEFDAASKVFTMAQIIHSFMYVLVAMRLLKTKDLATHLKGMDRKVGWLKKFAVGFLLFWVVDFLAVLWYFQQGYIDIRAYYLTMFCCAFAIHLLVFMAMGRNRVFMEVFLGLTKPKYRNSKLLEEDLSKHLMEIRAYMDAEKPYLDHEFSLSKLAKDLNKSKYLVSQVLNVEFGKGFYEFLNEYRFEEVKLRLKDPQYRHLTILAIAYDSGFSNKNTFNKVFKKQAGITPSEYLRSVS